MWWVLGQIHDFDSSHIKNKYLPPTPMDPASKRTAGFWYGHKYLVISGWVLHRAPWAICFRKVGMTLPEEPSTFPNLTAIKRVWLEGSWLSACTNISAALLEAPITLVGLMALSVEIKTKRSTLCRMDSFATTLVPHELFLIASEGWDSMRGMFVRVAWKTTSGFWLSKIFSTFSSKMSQMRRWYFHIPIQKFLLYLYIEPDCSWGAGVQGDIEVFDGIIRCQYFHCTCDQASLAANNLSDVIQIQSNTRWRRSSILTFLSDWSVGFRWSDLRWYGD